MRRLADALDDLDKKDGSLLSVGLSLDFFRSSFVIMPCSWARMRKSAVCSLA